MATHRFLLPRLFRWAAPGLCLALLAGGPPLLAQIASPTNAGGNAGNNAAGSSTTPISTPSFTAPAVLPTVPNVTVGADGSVTAAPQVISTVTLAVSTAVGGVDSILAPVVNAPPPAVGSVKTTDTVDIVLTPDSGPSQQVPTIGQLPQQLPTLLNAGETVGVSSRVTGNAGSITPTEAGLAVVINDQTVLLAASATEQQAMAEFAAIGIVAAMAPATLTTGASLVAIGADPVQTAQLMLALQNLALATTLTSLSNGITAFNTIVNASSESTLQALASQEVFLAARRTLEAARAAVAG